MSTAAPTPSGTPPQFFPPGRMFLNGTFDYLTIGGGLSLVAVGALALGGQLGADAPALMLVPVRALVSNCAHFAASTVRLYTKPRAFGMWPFLTMGFPLVSLIVLTIAIAWPEWIGANIQALYLTWSPYHYAAQAFGLACMYHYRSGGTLSQVDRQLLFATCMLPFLFAFLDITLVLLGLPDPVTDRGFTW